MEGMTTVKELVQKQDRFCTTELKGVSLSNSKQRPQEVPQPYMERKDLTIHMSSIWSLSAPRIFTKLLRPVMAYLRKKDLKMVIYLDNPS